VLRKVCLFLLVQTAACFVKFLLIKLILPFVLTVLRKVCLFPLVQTAACEVMKNNVVMSYGAKPMR